MRESVGEDRGAVLVDSKGETGEAAGSEATEASIANGDSEARPPGAPRTANGVLASEASEGSAERSSAGDRREP